MGEGKKKGKKRGQSSGADAPMGNTRSHPEHDGKDVGGRWYYAGDGMGEQVAARFIKKNRRKEGKP